MKFSDVLPHLEAGRRVRRACWKYPYQWHATEGGNWLSLEDGTKPHINVRRDLLASDWEVVPEEPAPAKPDAVADAWKRDAFHWMEEYGVMKNENTRLELAGIEASTTIARLTRELREANDYAVDFKATVERLTRERDEARALSAVMNRCCACCNCGGCQSRRQYAALGNQGGCGR